MRILGIAGSLRKASLNRQLLSALASLAPEGCEVEQRDISGIPVYDQDLEDEGMPTAVESLKEACAQSDGLLLVSPEYNQGVPGPLKNAIDWMSRPPADIGRVFRGRPVAITGATPGPNGTRAAQYAWLPTFRGLGLQLWFGGQLYVPGATNALGDSGRFNDEKLEERARQFMSGFADFIRVKSVGQVQ